MRLPCSWGEAKDAERGAVIDRRQAPGVAVVHHRRTVGDETLTVTCDREIRRDILGRDPAASSASPAGPSAASLRVMRSIAHARFTAVGRAATSTAALATSSAALIVRAANASA